MSEIIDAAVAVLSERLGGGFDGTAKFVVEDEGAIMVTADGVQAGDADADVTLSADTDTFRGIIEGEINPTAAFMSGKLKIEGDMGLAMQLGGALA